MTNFFFLKIDLFSIFFFVTFSFSKNFNSKLFFILLSSFFSIHGIFVNEGFHFLTFSKFTSDFALPPFSIFSCIDFFFESKFKKNLLSTFFKFQKMTIFFFLYFFRIFFFVIFSFSKNFNSKLFLFYFQLFFLSMTFL